MKYSVVICTYNGEKYIKEQIKSILDQTHKVDEILLFDDSSNDNTLIKYSWHGGIYGVYL
ncbi:glycosyltransferase [Ruminococcus flavefaciens]|uniref:glycosyltransferase n=1 Tax=Ruminococcus flavefaciens TaxID=1265 RepID=UPI0004903EB0|nr:glycosyltransferase [Ruminococcus flavefaciens]